MKAWDEQTTTSLNATTQQLEIAKAVLSQDGWTKNETTTLLLALVVEVMDT